MQTLKVWPEVAAAPNPNIHHDLKTNPSYLSVVVHGEVQRQKLVQPDIKQYIQLTHEWCLCVGVCRTKIVEPDIKQYTN